MSRALVVATLLALSAGAASGQAPGVLRINVTLTDATRASIPVPRHALLISDNPASGPPRRILTKPDGTAEVSLRPGSYTVESDEPVAFGGKGYQWTQIVEITAGRDSVLALTAENAEVGDPPVRSAASATSMESSPSLLLSQWQASVVAIWTPQSRASGFVVDAAGLVVTNQRAIGGASAVEVQLAPELKVAARVLAADAARDVAVLWIDPATAASVRPLPLPCADGSKSTLAQGQEVAAIGAPLRSVPSGAKDVFEGQVVRVEPRASAADFRLAPGGAGGPVFSANGAVAGISSIADEPEAKDDARIIPIDAVCDAVKSAGKAMQTAPPPVATHLPVEPLRPFPADALNEAVKRGAVQMNAYQLSSSGFDLTFLTPVLIHGARERALASGMAQETLAAALDFGDWSDYFADVPPVLVVRVTPRLTESFWTTVARAAAYTQGAVIPPIKHFKPGFARLQAFCGDAEVTPIHPFILARRVSETDAVREGLYVFDPAALGPHCKSVRLVMYSEKDPTKPDARVVDAQLIERVWNDFAPFRR